MIAEEKQIRLAAEKEVKEREQQKTKEMAHENVIQEIQQTNRDVSQETKSSQVDTHCDLDGFVLKDADPSETAILQNFLNGLGKNHLERKDSCYRNSEGSIEIKYKGVPIGSFYLQNGKGWLSYQIGNSGKSKKIDGTGDELALQMSKWIRYIMNYM